MTRTIRFTIGRWLIHAGIKAMPPGKSRAELTNLLWTWNMKVMATLAAQRGHL